MVTEIPLTRGYVALVDDEDVERINTRAWRVVGVKSGRVYARNGNNEDMHRVLMNAPPGVQIDHVNGDGLDNRRTNLRFATRAQNAANAGPRPGSSRFKGVSRHRYGWAAFIGDDGTTKFLGRFDTEEEAARAYDRAALAVFGAFAWLNFPAGEPRAPEPPTGRVERVLRKASVELTCPVCGLVFRRHRYLIGKHKRFFCSHRCSGAGRRGPRSAQEVQP